MNKLAAIITVAGVAILYSLSAFSSVRTTCPQKTARDYYFVSSSSNPVEKSLNDFEIGMHSSYLRAMGEPSLSCGTTDNTYRFTWLRSFHNPISVRVTQNGHRFIMVATELSNTDGNGPRKVARQKKVILTSTQFLKIQEAIKETKFWGLRTNDNKMGTDGSTWILEASESKRYHFVTRWSPERGPVRSIGMLFIQVTGWNFANDPIY